MHEFLTPFFKPDITVLRPTKTMNQRQTTHDPRPFEPGAAPSTSDTFSTHFSTLFHHKTVHGHAFTFARYFAVIAVLALKSHAQADKYSSFRF
jgi:hypothetical protein